MEPDRIQLDVGGKTVYNRPFKQRLPKRSYPDGFKFVIHIEPVPAGRPRFTKYGHAFDPTKSRIYKQQVRDDILSHLKGQNVKFNMTCPKIVNANFYRSNQKNTSKIERKRREKGTSLPTKKPDLDNYLKSTIDALEGIFWHDDSQIVEINSHKYYSDDPRIEFEVKDWNENEN